MREIKRVALLRHRHAEFAVDEPPVDGQAGTKRHAGKPIDFGFSDARPDQREGDAAGIDSLTALEAGPGRVRFYSKHPAAADLLVHTDLTAGDKSIAPEMAAFTEIEPVLHAPGIAGMRSGIEARPVVDLLLDRRLDRHPGIGRQSATGRGDQHDRRACEPNSPHACHDAPAGSTRTIDWADQPDCGRAATAHRKMLSVSADLRWRSRARRCCNSTGRTASPGRPGCGQ